jgi:hypothetical protein
MVHGKWDGDDGGLAKELICWLTRHNGNGEKMHRALCDYVTDLKVQRAHMESPVYEHIRKGT